MKSIKIRKSLIHKLSFFIFAFVAALGIITNIGGGNLKVNAISCGGGSCPDGYSYGGDANAGQSSCAARAQEACASHQGGGGGNSGGNGGGSGGNSGGGGIHCDAGTCNDGYSFGSDDHFGGGSCSNRNTSACASHGGIQSGGQGTGGNSGGSGGNTGGGSTCDSGSSSVCVNTGFTSCHNYSGSYNCECYPASAGSNSCRCYQDTPPGQSSFACGTYVNQSCISNANCDASHICSATSHTCVPGNNSSSVDSRPVCSNIGTPPSSSRTGTCCAGYTPGAGGVCANPPTAASSVSSLSSRSSSSLITDNCSNVGENPNDSSSRLCCSPLVPRGGICQTPPSSSGSTGTGTVGKCNQSNYCPPGGSCRCPSDCLDGAGDHTGPGSYTCPASGSSTTPCSLQNSCQGVGAACCSPGTPTPDAIVGRSCTSGSFCSAAVVPATGSCNAGVCGSCTAPGSTPSGGASCCPGYTQGAGGVCGNPVNTSSSTPSSNCIPENNTGLGINSCCNSSDTKTPLLGGSFAQCTAPSGGSSASSGGGINSSVNTCIPEGSSGLGINSCCNSSDTRTPLLGGSFAQCTAPSGGSGSSSGGGTNSSVNTCIPEGSSGLGINSCCNSSDTRTPLLGGSFAQCTAPSRGTSSSSGGGTNSSVNTCIPEGSSGLGINSCCNSSDTRTPLLGGSFAQCTAPSGGSGSSLSGGTSSSANTCIVEGTSGLGINSCCNSSDTRTPLLGGSFAQCTAPSGGSGSSSSGGTSSSANTCIVEGTSGLGINSCCNSSDTRTPLLGGSFAQCTAPLGGQSSSSSGGTSSSANTCIAEGTTGVGINSCCNSSDTRISFLGGSFAQCTAPLGGQSSSSSGGTSSSANTCIAEGTTGLGINSCCNTLDTRTPFLGGSFVQCDAQSGGSRNDSVGSCNQSNYCAAGDSCSCSSDCSGSDNSSVHTGPGTYLCPVISGSENTICTGSNQCNGHPPIPLDNGSCAVGLYGDLSNCTFTPIPKPDCFNTNQPCAGKNAGYVIGGTCTITNKERGLCDFLNTPMGTNPPSGTVICSSNSISSICDGRPNGYNPDIRGACYPENSSDLRPSCFYESNSTPAPASDGSSSDTSQPSDQSVTPSDGLGSSQPADNPKSSCNLVCPSGNTCYIMENHPRCAPTLN